MEQNRLTKIKDMKRLSDCEMLVMKCIWDADKDLSVLEIKDALKEKYGRDYERTTICTFGTRLKEKGFVETYRKGHGFRYHPLVSKIDMRDFLLQEMMEFWYEGSAVNFMNAFCNNVELTADEAEEIVSLIKKAK
ncbi:MAG: BlaI/MecI/CopY family transcriptional regulator [Clostridiales bacterium]|nr:BlaI/MecI/CopY family transcriptional regulator [Clostridiales bacterium]